MKHPLVFTVVLLLVTACNTNTNPDPNNPAPNSANLTASVVEKMGLTRAPVAATLPSHPVANAFAELWLEVGAHLGLEILEEEST